MYTLNLLLSFQCGCVLAHDYKKTEVRDGLRVARYYVLYGRFWLDALAMVPFVYLVRGGWGGALQGRRQLPVRYVAVHAFCCSCCCRCEQDPTWHHVRGSECVAVCLAFQMAALQTLSHIVLLNCSSAPPPPHTHTPAPAPTSRTRS